MPKHAQTSPVLLSLLVTFGAAAPWAAAQEGPVLVPQSGHGSTVAGMDFFHDGSLLLSWEETGTTAIVWDLSTAKQLRTLSLPWAPILGQLRRNAQGDPVAYFAFGDAVRVYDVRTGAPGDSLVLPAGGLVSEWANGGDGGQVWARGYTIFQANETTALGIVALQRPEGGRVLYGTGYHHGPFGSHMTVSPDGSLLAVAGNGTEDGLVGDDGIDGIDAIGLWDTASGELVGEIGVPGESVRGIGFLPSGQLLLVNRDEGVLELYSVPDGLLLQRLETGMGTFVAMAVSPRGDRVATAQAVMGTHLWALNGDGAEARLASQPLAFWAGGRHLAFSRDGATLVEAPGSFDLSFGSPIHLVDAASGRSLRTLANRVRPARWVSEGAGGLLVTSGDDNVLRIWDGRAGEPFRTVPQPIAGPVAAHPGKPLVVSGGYSSTWAEQQRDPALAPYGLAIHDLSTSEPARLLRVFNGPVSAVAFDASGDVLTAASADSTVHVWRGVIEGEGTVLRAPAPVADLALDPGGGWVAAALNRYGDMTSVEGAPEGTPVVRIWHLSDVANPVDVTVMRFAPTAVAASPDGEALVLVGTDGFIRMVSVHDGLELIQGFLGAPLTAVAATDNAVLVGSSSGEIIRMTADGSGVDRALAHPGGVTRLVVRPEGGVLSTGVDGTTRLWSGDGGEIAAFQAVLPEALATRDTVSAWDLMTRGDDPEARLAYLQSRGGFLVTLPDGRYRASRGALDAAVMREGLRAIPLARHDLAFNRPDAVVAALGGPTQLVEAYARARERRLARAGVAEAEAKADLSAPLPLVTLDRGSVPTSTSARRLALVVHAGGEHAPLDRLEVRLNDVPLNLSGEGSLGGRTSVDTTLTLELSDGRNRVEVTSWDVDGQQSVPAVVEVVYTGPAAAAELYILTLGVSDYADDRFDLKYAAKDARDIAAGFAAQEGRYRAVHTLTLTDAEVTRDALPRARAFLEQAGIHDEVVVFFAGHGLLDPDLNYWFGTHDLDFTQPGLRGLAYDDIQALVTGLESRAVLLLMDTCHSGEVDEEAVPRPSATSVTARGFPRAGVVGGTRLGLSNSYKLLNELFFDFGAGTGATVLAAAAGVEFAFEAPEWDNGVFTYALLSGLRSGRADLDRDGAVQLSELTDFVSARVAELTEGRQTPTARAQALERDYVVYARPVLRAGAVVESRLEPGVSPEVLGAPAEEWSLSADAGGAILIEVTSAAFDPRVEITGPGTLESDFEFRREGGPTTVRVCVVPPESGTYRIKVTSLDGAGAFTLRVTAASCTPGPGAPD